MLNLFLDLRKRFSLTYVFISHDLAVVRLFSQRIAVMYLGKVAETGITENVFRGPMHPYTQSLLAAVPKIGGARVTENFWLQGEPPSPSQLPEGCRFNPRCPFAEDICRREEPELRVMDDGRSVACHFAEKIGAQKALQLA